MILEKWENTWKNIKSVLIRGQKQVVLSLVEYSRNQMRAMFTELPGINELVNGISIAVEVFEK